MDNRFPPGGGELMESRERHGCSFADFTYSTICPSLSEVIRLANGGGGVSLNASMVLGVSSFQASSDAAAARLRDATLDQA